MDYREEIKQLEYDKAMCLFDQTTGEEKPMNEDCRKAFEADELAIEALKKQIPMKPNLEKNFDGWKFYTCPNCKIIRHDFDSYCDNCGQAIDRSEL